MKTTAYHALLNSLLQYCFLAACNSFNSTLHISSLIHYYHVYYYYQGKIRDVDLGADSSASAESEPEDVSTTYLLLYYSDDVATFLRSEITHSQSQSERRQMVLINVFFMDIIIP